MTTRSEKIFLKESRAFRRGCERTCTLCFTRFGKTADFGYICVEHHHGICIRCLKKPTVAVVASRRLGVEQLLHPTENVLQPANTFVTMEEAASNRSWYFWRLMTILGSAVAAWFAVQLIKIVIQHL